MTVSVFSSYFWLWSIIGLLGLLVLSTLGALLNLTGFVSPVRRLMRWVDDLPVVMQAGMVAVLFGLVAYPSVIHALWANATADETRRVFESLPRFPGARPGSPTEQMGGLYDPTGTDGSYIIGWYGTAAPFEDVRAYYEPALRERGWVEQGASSAAGSGRGLPASPRLQFRDHPEAAQAHYELLLAQLPPSTREAPAEITGQRTLYALRLGITDPRATTQVAWLIDCLVRRAPTFPTCEAMGWNPLEQVLGPRP